MTLYEVKEELAKAIEECMDEETGEVFDQERLNKAFKDWNEKIESCMCYVKNLKAQAEAIKTEQSRLAERRRVIENKADNLMEYLQATLEGQTFESARGRISYRKSESVEVDLEAFMKNAGCEEFLKYEEPKPNKAEIKNAIKNGACFEGVSIITKQNMQIK